jgi:Ser/Thr protein kinase RdoA (MazF antagonist)
VLRPSNPHTPSIHAFLRSVRRAGFDGVPAPVGLDDDGRERVEYIEGEVALPLYPGWARTDRALVSLATLMARFHRAARFESASGSWSDELADPEGGPIVCHNDVCLENVVFREGIAVALLDFDFCAPGRPVYDLAQCARMCVPIDDDASAAQLGWEADDRPARLRLMSDAYGLGRAGRTELLELLDDAVAHGGEFVWRHVEAGDPNFTAMWEWMGGAERWDRRRRWWAEERPEFAAALS